MRRRRRTMMILFVLWVSPVWAATRHDCRIGQVTARVTQAQDGAVHIRTRYLGIDGKPLNTSGCPDLEVPTYGGEANDPWTLSAADSEGFHVFSTDMAPGVHVVQIATTQRRGEVGNPLAPRGVFGYVRFRVR